MTEAEKTPVAKAVEEAVNESKPAETKPEMEQFVALPLNGVQALLNYLADRPWKEVDAFIQLVQQRGVPVELPKRAP
jgi:hypothetical protein